MHVLGNWHRRQNVHLCPVCLCDLLIFQVCSVLTSVCKKEGLLLPPELAKKISEKSGRNLRKALLMCEACRVQQWVTAKPVILPQTYLQVCSKCKQNICAAIMFSRYPFSADQEVPEADWEIYLRDTANAIVSQQSPQRYERKWLGEVQLFLFGTEESSDCSIL